jgi:hypothetical protein
MNSLLYPQPQGALMDPRSQAITQMGLGLLSSGGPQSMPMGLGQAFGQAGMQGMQAFQQAQQAQQQEAFRQLQMKKMEEQMEMERQRALRDAQPRPQSLAPGGMLVGPDGRVIVQAPFKPEAPQKPTAPMTRTVQMGGEKVTQEYVNGEWKEIGRGPMFQPVKPPAAPKAPTGFRYKPDSDELEPIPGGPKDTTPKDNARASGAIQKADTVIGKVDEALGKVGFSSTGLTGTVLGMVPGTQAYDLDKTIDTIKANLGFSELQAMRDASPTGGALGQVAIQELAMLQSTIASLDKGQKQESLVKGLEQVRKHFQNWKNAVLQAQQGAQPTTPAAPSAPKRRVFNPANGKFE